MTTFCHNFFLEVKLQTTVLHSTIIVEESSGLRDHWDGHLAYIMYTRCIKEIYWDDHT